MLSFAPVVRTEVGLVRADNEDAAYAGRRGVVVADGMGGQAAGEVASATSVDAAARALEARTTGGPDEIGAESLLRDVAARAHEALRGLVDADPALTGTSTTFTALVCDEGGVVLGHVGDSRAYRWRDGQLDQLSHDHTLVQSMVDAGRISPRQARDSHQRHLLLRALGAERPVGLDLLPVDLLPGDRVLLCSDGLSDLVEDPEIELLLSGPPDEAADALVEAALRAGGIDNVTVLVADLVDADDTAAPPPAGPVGVRVGAGAPPEAADGSPVGR